MAALLVVQFAALALARAAFEHADNDTRVVVHQTRDDLILPYCHGRCSTLRAQHAGEKAVSHDVECAVSWRQDRIEASTSTSC